MRRHFQTYVRGDPGQTEVVHRYENLAAGRYRVTEPDTGGESEPVDLSRGEERELVVELGAMGWIEGTVEVPEGMKASDARVFVEGLPEGTYPPTVYVRRDGSFKVKVPTNRDLTLRPRHPLLRPLPGSETLVVRAPKKDLRFVMIEGPLLVVSWPGPAPEAPRHQLHRIGVTLHSPDQSGSAVGTWELLREKDETVWRGGGFAPGTYDLLFDVPGYVPFKVESVKIEDGDNPLTLPTPDRGTTIRIRLLVEEGQSPPRIFASAHHQGEPRYVRYLNSRGEAEVLLSGLGTGRYKVQAFPMRDMGRPKRSVAIDEEIEVDGKSDLTFELDFRK